MALTAGRQIAGAVAALAHAVSALAEPEVIYPLLVVASAVAARRADWRHAATPGRA